MNTYTLESFINFCDDMMIAEEGFNFKSIRDFGKNILQFIKTIWTGFINVFKWIKRKLSEKIGRNRIKPSVEISRLNEENRMLKEKLEETQELLEKTTNALYNETDISASLTEKLVKSQYDVDELQNKVDKLQKDLVETHNRKKECEEAIKVLDSIYNDISNYKKITAGDIEYYSESVEEFEKYVNDILDNSITGDIKEKLSGYYHPETVFKNNLDLRLKSREEIREKRCDDIKKRMNTYKDKFKEKPNGSLHRIQVFYVLESINLLNIDIEIFGNLKEKLESLIRKINSVEDNVNNQHIIGLRQKMQELVLFWVGNIENDQNLVKALSSILEY